MWPSLALTGAQSQTKFVDESLRRSRFRALVDGPLFDAAAALVAAVSAQDEMYSYRLVRNDVTEIVYEKGGFFQRHQVRPPARSAGVS